MRPLIALLLVAAAAAPAAAQHHVDTPEEHWQNALDSDSYVTPPPAPAPDWCGGYTSPHAYPGGSFQAIELAIDRNDGTPQDAALGELARASCDLPPGHKNYTRRNASVARARARWTRLDGSTDAEQKRYLRYFITHTAAQATAAAAELCKPLTTSKDLFAVYADEARRIVNACDAREPTRLVYSSTFLYWIDTPGYEPSALVRLFALHTCLLLNGGSYCAYDAARVDLPALDAEAAASASLGELGALHVHFYAATELRRLAPHLAQLTPEMVAEAAKSGEGWKQIYAARKAELDRAVAIQRTIFFDNQVPSDADCDAARADLHAISAASTAKTLEEATSLYTSPANFLVREGVAECDAIAGAPGIQAVAADYSYEPRGPRMMTMRALSNPDRMANSFGAPWLTRPAWSSNLGSRAPRGQSLAVVKSVKVVDGDLEVAFAKETMPFEENYACVDTGRISGIDDHWNIRYGVHCQTRTVALDITRDPVRVPARYGAGVRPGVALRYAEFGTTLAFPIEVWTGAKHATLAAFGGFALGKP